MQSIVIGDVHGCFYTLKSLLEKVSFDPKQDHLYFLGDLVGKGKYSDLVLDYVMGLPNCDIVLGNNDIEWLMDYLLGSTRRKDFRELSVHKSAKLWADFLVKQSLAIVKDFGTLVHASVCSEWTEDDVLAINQRLTKQLRDDTIAFLSMCKNSWEDFEAGISLTGDALNLDILLTCRYYDVDGEWSRATGAPEDHQDLVPWYTLERKIKKPVIFGHWAALRGRKLPLDINLDGGAVYGGALMALRGETMEIIRVGKHENDS